MQLALNDGAYLARSVIASAQRCVNLYPEKAQLNTALYLPQQMTQALYTHYPTPGLTLLANIGTGPIRGTYMANNGTLYVVSGAELYSVSSSWAATALGAIDAGTTPVSMADNSLELVLVDGTANGYTVTFSSGAFAQISDPAFYGADFVDYLDTFMYFNKPGTPQFYSTTSEVVTPFDALYFANKTGYGDNLVRAVSMHREIWLIGELTTEVWYDAGNATFPFAEVPGAFIQHGCVAKYSIAVKHEAIFWLSQNEQGQNFVLMGSGYDVERVSTHAIEFEFSQYPTVTDAIGFLYQQGGHEFYVLTFPTADKTWVYDNISQLWHERTWLDTSGLEHRIRAMCCASAYGQIVCGDWQNGNLYKFDVNNYTDNGEPIRRIRSFPTMQNELKRVRYDKFIADMQVGSDPNNESATINQVGLRYSDTGGQNWSDTIYQPIGQTGQFNTNMQWRKNGIGRRRVYELSWTVPVPTALNGAYIDVTACTT